MIIEGPEIFLFLWLHLQLQWLKYIVIKDFLTDSASDFIYN